MFGALIQYGLPALLAVGTWAWSKLRGEKTQSIKDLATGIARQAVHDLVGAPDAASKASSYIEGKVIDGLASKLGMSSSTLATFAPIIDPIVEHAVADLLDELRERTAAAATLQANLDQLSAVVNLLSPDHLEDLAKQAHDKAAADFADVIERDDTEAPAAPATSSP